MLVGGIWKCGNCAGVDDSMLVYSEVNDLDADVTDEPVEVQVIYVYLLFNCEFARVEDRTIEDKG